MKQTQALLINKQKQQNNTRQKYLRVIKIYISLIQNGLCYGRFEPTDPHCLAFDPNETNKRTGNNSVLSSFL